MDREADPGGEVPRRRFWLSLDSVGVRLLALALLSSTVVTLLLTVGQVWFDYRRDVDSIEYRLGQIRSVYLDSIAESLWNVDEQQLALELRGILRLPDIGSAEVRAVPGDAIVAAEGRPGPGAVVERTFPLVHRTNGEDVTIGSFRVTADLGAVYARLFEEVLFILVTHGFKTFVVSLFSIWLAHRLITRHLFDVARFVRTLDLARPGAQTVRLRRRSRGRPDELEDVARALNAMSTKLQKIYDDVRDSEKRFRDYAEIASDWFWETDPALRFTSVSERLADFGIDPEGVIGRGFRETATDADEDPEKWRVFETALAERRPFYDFVFRAVRRDGSAIHVRSTGRPIHDAAGTFLGYRGISHDVTELVDGARILAEAAEREKRHLAERLEAEAERHRLLERIVDSEERQRRRIARELHDQMGQDLTGLSLGLESLDGAVHDDEPRRTLKWLQGLTSQIGRVVHRAAWELRPTALDDLGLARALSTYLSDWGERFRVRVDYQAVVAEIDRFAGNIETTVYRIVQEALTNILKHAEARTISVVLAWRDGELRVVIEDDGRGFDADAAAVSGGLGLAGMRERLALVDGALAVDTAVGSGTTLLLRIPCRPLALV